MSNNCVLLKFHSQLGYCGTCLLELANLHQFGNFCLQWEVADIVNAAHCPVPAAVQFSYYYIPSQFTHSLTHCCA